MLELKLYVRILCHFGRNNNRGYVTVEHWQPLRGLIAFKNGKRMHVLLKFKKLGQELSKFRMYINPVSFSCNNFYINCC